MEDRRKEALRDYYERLPPEEWRARVILKAEFRDAYNDLVEADRQFPVPQYLWEKWVPIVGLFPVGVYLELRRMCFVNRATGERRDWCWPRQETIAKRLGVKKRHTVGKALQVLEAKGFIKREPSYHRRGADALVRRGADRYLVYFEIPLVPADAAELLLRRISPVEQEGGSWKAGAGVSTKCATPSENGASPDVAAKRPHREGAVEKSGEEASDMAEKRPYAAGRETASRTVTRTINTNVSNVGMSGDKKRLDRTVVESLALEVGQCLSTWAGTRQVERHASEGFHRLVASRMPEHLVRQALTATRDAVERTRSGKGGCVRGPAAYFAGVVKNLAAEHGIDLGLSKSRSRPGASGENCGQGTGPRSGGGDGRGQDREPRGVEESKAAVRRLVESVQSRRGM